MTSTSTVHLEPADVSLLSEVLSAELASLRSEIHHSARGEYRRGLQSRCERLSRVANALDA